MENLMKLNSTKLNNVVLQIFSMLPPVYMMQCVKPWEKKKLSIEHTRMHTPHGTHAAAQHE